MSQNKLYHPHLMQDGRFITYYGRTSDLNNMIMNNYNLKNSEEFKTFLQTKGVELVKTVPSGFDQYLTPEYSIVDPNDSDKCWKAYYEKVKYKKPE
jgi:hypothetical protein